MNITIINYDTIDSTNTEALKQAKLGADEGLCIIARGQTTGRGRHGRTWVSEEDAGLYFSIVLRPALPHGSLSLVTLMTGVAVYETISEFGCKPDIKWVNDILVNEKKISGILAETVETETGLAVVVGIGINLRDTNFPDEIASIATSIEAETGRRIEPEALSQTLIPFIIYFYERLKTDPAEIIREWQRRSSYFAGKAVRVRLENETLEGFTDGLEPNGALRLTEKSGTLRIIQAGDVEQLRRE